MSKSKSKRIKVESVDVNGEEVIVWAVKPGAKEFAGAKVETSKAFQKGMRLGVVMRESIDKYMRDQGVWDDAKQEELQVVEDKITNGLKALQQGGDLFEGYDVALQIKEGRNEQSKLNATYRQLDSNSLEAHMDNASMDYLAYSCIKDEEGNKKFTNLQDYLSNSHEPWVQISAAKVAFLAFELDEDWQMKLPENQFLKAYGFLNEDDMLLDKDKKHLVALDGRKINKEGIYIEDEDGAPIEIYQWDKPFGDFKKNGRKVSPTKTEE